jgi:hypothetical protein
VRLLILLLTSYLTASMEMPICGLAIVLRPDDTDLDLLELVKAYCDILGYRTTDQKPLMRNTSLSAPWTLGSGLVPHAGNLSTAR